MRFRAEKVGLKPFFLSPPHFAQKNRLNFGRTFFLLFFWRSPNFGQQKRLNFGKERFCFVFFLLEITLIWMEKPTQSDQSSIKILVKIV